MTFIAVQKAVDRLFEEGPIHISAATLVAVTVVASIIRGGKGRKGSAEEKNCDQEGDYNAIHA
jgi:hypothetical protein